MKSRQIEQTKQAILNLKRAIASIDADPGPDYEEAKKEHEEALQKYEAKLIKLEGAR